MIEDVFDILIPAVTSFMIGIAITPIITHFLYTHKMWKKKGGKTALDGTAAVEFNRLHGNREGDERSTPRLGGLVVWLSVLLTALLYSVIASMSSSTFWSDVGFISRSQTWVPLATLLLGSIAGAIDDFYEVLGKGGLRLRVRLGIVGAISLLCAWWFYSKLGVSSISVPFIHAPLQLGILFIPFFVLVAVFIYAGGIIDGIDGLAGGVFTSMFVAYAGIATFEHEPNLAALSAVIAGGLLAFLWFNIPPARFYLSETGTMGLTLTLTVIAFLTDTHAGGRGLSVLPLIALPLCITVISNIAQVLSKKFFHHKLLRIAPLHHHFEAIGWPSYKVTMRYWVVGIVCAIVGMILAIA
ncbi:MAG TPA: hypothetical protein VF803_03600 [Candidatus Paceibacterota bacterium]